MAWCSGATRPLYSLALSVLFGVLLSASEASDREEGFGTIDCPHSLTVQWNKILERPPYVEAKQNSTNEFDGLFPSNAFEIYELQYSIVVITFSIFLFFLVYVLFI